MNILKVIGFFSLAAGLIPSLAIAESHAYIGMMRSGNETHVFISQSVEGMYGRFRLTEDSTTEQGVAAALESGSYQYSEFWQGYNIRTAVGLELMKFIQFSIAHEGVTLRSRSSSFENLRGSSLNGEGKLVFQSPIGNLEAGAGIIGSRFDFQRKLEDASFYGSGLYYLLGWNYFLTYQVSVFGVAKVTTEHFERNSGSTSISGVDADMTSLGFGFDIWL